MVETVAKRNTITTNPTLPPTPPVVKTSDEKPNPNTDDDTLLSPRTNRTLLAETLESVQINRRQKQKHQPVTRVLIRMFG